MNFYGSFLLILSLPSWVAVEALSGEPASSPAVILMKKKWESVIIEFASIAEAENPVLVYPILLKTNRATIKLYSILDFYEKAAREGKQLTKSNYLVFVKHLGEAFVDLRRLLEEDLVHVSEDTKSYFEFMMDVILEDFIGLWDTLSKT